nr:hypothetical protein [uncultured Flavobacterium sp.]
MKSQKNIELRTKVLEYALDIENSVNTFLVVHFEINDHIKSKNFGSKAGISFKNKIDLLYDLEVLTKEEHNDLEIFMVFRNKFLHDLECSTFEIALKTIDSGIRNKLLNFLDEQTNDLSEKKLEKAYFNLFLKCFKMLVSKYEKRIEKIENIRFLVNGFITNYEELLSFSLKTSANILKTLAESELENPKILALSNIISEKCLKLSDDIQKVHLDFESKATLVQENFSSINLGKIK